MSASKSQVVGLVAKNSPDYVRRFFACLSEGIVVVTLRSANDGDRINACGINKVVEPGDGYGWIDSQTRFRESADLAQVAFTSGTEGEPKGVLLTHSNLSNTMRRLQEKMDMDASIREYVGIPVYHSFGFGRCRVIAFVGGRAYLPQAGFNIKEICSLLAADQINAISAVPSLWRIVLKNRNLIERYGNKVRWIEIGSQPMSGEEKMALRTIFPSARIVQHYGLTEASRSTLLDVSSAHPHELDSVGEPNGDVRIDTSEAGRIRIRGGHVAAEVLIAGRPVRNIDEEGWFRTNDLGEVRDGKLYFEGRLDHVINSGGIKVSPDLLETQVMAALRIEAGISIAKIPDQLRGDGVLVAIRNDVRHSDQKILDACAEALRGSGVDAASSIHAMRVDGFPITESGKVKRQMLSERFQESLKPPPVLSRQSNAPGTGTVGSGESSSAGIRALVTKWAPARKNTVRGLYEGVFPARKVGGEDTFVSLGGDSLSFVDVSIGLEELLGQLPNNWQNLTVAELEAIRPRETFLHLVDTSLVLRFLSIVAIVAGHFTSLYVGGATYLLLVIVGFNFARFQLSNVLATGSVAPVLVSAFRLGLPLFLMVAALEIRHQKLELMSLALLGNWEDQATQQMDFWFVHLVVQVLVIVAAIMSVPAIRGWARSSSQGFGYLLLSLAVATALLVPLLWSTKHLYDRVPHMLMWLFALGWIVYQATSPVQKVIAVALATTLPLLVWGTEGLPFWVAYGPLWVAAGCIALLFVPKVPLPRAVSRLVYWVGGASMFIYIVHWSARGIWNRIIPGENPVLDVFVGIAAGVVAWTVWEAMTRYLLRILYKRKVLASEPDPL